MSPAEGIRVEPHLLWQGGKGAWLWGIFHVIAQRNGRECKDLIQTCLTFDLSASISADIAVEWMMPLLPRKLDTAGLVGQVVYAAEYKRQFNI